MLQDGINCGMMAPLIDRSHLIADLDKKYLANEDQFQTNAERICRAREAQGKGSMHLLLQPFSRPNVNELLGSATFVYPSC